MNKNIKTLFSDTVILGIGTFMSKALVLLLMPLYTSYLTPEMYSTAELISQTANLLMPFAMVGIADAVFRFTFEKKYGNESVLSTGFFVLLVGFSVFLALTPLYTFIPKIGGYSVLLIAYVLAADIHSLTSNYVRAAGKTKLFALQGIINTVLTIVLNVIFLVAFNMGILGYVLSVIIANMLVTIFLTVVAIPLPQIKLRFFNKDLAREMLKYCIPLIPTTIFWWITNVSDRYIVSMICGDAANGLYAASYKIPTLLTLATAVFNEAWQKFAFTEKGRPDNSKSENGNSYYYERVFSLFSNLIFLACSALILFAKPAAKILLSSQYHDAWLYIPVLLVATAFVSLVTFLSSVYSLKKKTVTSLWTALVGAVLNIVLNLLLIPWIGALGAAVATMIAYITVFIIRAQNIKKYLRFRIYSVSFLANVTIILVQCFITTYFSEPMYIAQGVLFLCMMSYTVPKGISVIKGFISDKN